MRKALGIVCMALGLALVAGAAWMLYTDHAEEAAAGVSAEANLAALRASMSEAVPAAVTPAPTPAAAAPDEADMPGHEASAAPPTATPLPEMPTQEVDGETYIGYLELPTLGQTLPVMSEWSYGKLKLAPCRYWGSVYDKMVLLAHRYMRHFGRIRELEIGDPVQFVDVEGNIYRYEVVATEILEKPETERMITGDWDLTLFTCTPSGVNRVTVRLKRVVAF